MAEQRFRPFLKTDTNERPIQQSSNDMAFRGDYAGTNIIYAGFARPGVQDDDPFWQIRKFTYDGANNLISITWPQKPAGGSVSSEYEFQWSQRGSYTYA